MIDPQERWVIFASSMRGGGAERMMLSLAQEVAERSYAVHLVLAQAEGPVLADARESVWMVDLKASRVLLSLPALVGYLQGERPAAMLSVVNHIDIVALSARRLAGAPTRVVVCEHNTLSQSVQHASSWRGRLMPQLIRRFYPWADDIVAVSKEVADDLAQVAAISREDIQVVYNPRVTPELRKKAQVYLDHPWSQVDQPPVLLAVGSLTTHKDFPTLIQAFARVRQTCPVRLLILGEGQERPALGALVRKLGLEQDVSLPGFVENPYVYMARASVFVLSSRWEGLPTVLVEALYCGAPIVATDCPSGPREILADGELAILRDGGCCE